MKGGQWVVGWGLINIFIVKQHKDKIQLSALLKFTIRLTLWVGALFYHKNMWLAWSAWFDLGDQ